MGIYDEVLDWSSTRLPQWRQDALRRLCTNGAWSEADLLEILDLVKQTHGLTSEYDPALSPVPLSADDFPNEAYAGTTVALTSLHGLENVGLIPTDQRLDFGVNGLTLVYGNNGAGKSGYARILKQACRSRSPGTVFPNAYDPRFAELTPSAVIEYTVNESASRTSWRPGNVSPAVLRGVAVFDSECALHYLQAREVASFQPVALTYLQRLASDLNSALRPKIQAEIDRLTLDSSAFSVIPLESEAGRSVHPITAARDLTRARQLAELTSDERAELARLPAEINETDPSAKAALLDQAAGRLAEICDQIESKAGLVSDDALDRIEKLGADLAAAEAAEVTSSQRLREGEGELLPGTGQSAWEIMFAAARTFSTTVAYPGSDFPTVESGARCVLCQQQLGDEAKARLSRFDQYIRDTVSVVARAARLEWDAAVQRSLNIDVNFTIGGGMLESLGKRIDDLPERIRQFQSELACRADWLRAALATRDWSERPALKATNPVASIRSVAEALQNEASVLRTNLDLEALTAKRVALKELQARELLSQHIERITAVVDQMVIKSKLEACLQDVANSRPISVFAGQIARRYISQTLADAMNEELEKLDLYHVRVSVSSAGDAGSVRLGIVLLNSNLDPHLVLSEAEQRICSLAYFFAELQQSGSTSGVVFDDPVSSLDHGHRGAVARRIVDEVARRQVIVFTHDAVFFGELMTLSEDAGREPTVRSIVYRAQGPGFVDAGLPYDLRKHRERIAMHRADQERIAAHFHNPPGDPERMAMRNAYDDLRVTIEVGIEETVLNQTVVRFRDGISVGRLDGVMIVEDDEFREVQRLHNRCCRHVRAHSHAAGQQRAVAQPAELLEDILAIDALFSAIRRRRG